ncbi:PH domain-containing protein [Boeremia exigua]|uniref:PH domain-containing protein n=1 Tax=Boeremia exigua TaxID=749465 RepID=UPI001E8E0C17|nr:PH domain-containing protein [Boeremia exigua]KAH6637567.1 PH domain-containing protein [Boeremia exigua]
MAGVPSIDDPSHLSRGYGDSSHLQVGVNDFATTPERRGRFEEEFDARTRGSSVLDGDLPQRSASRASSTLREATLNQGSTPSRSGTLKKKGSVKRAASLKRSGSRKSMHAGSIRGVTIDDQEHGYDREDSVFYTPVPTKGSPTEILADRFQTWRKFLKDLIAYFREVSSSYEHRAKSLLKVSNVINNTNAPASLLSDGGLNEATRFLRDFHKQAIVDANKARDIEADVINQLSGLRADLAQKIKEIKSLSGDFKNNVEKEKENTRKCVTALEEALAVVDSDPSAIAGKGDPYVVRLGVERQVERQIDEENYLHRAYLNLENSGRELESIVVGEIQKAYNALASILKRDADEMYATVDKLRSGPIAMPRDQEWGRFVRTDSHFVNPDLPLRRLEDIEYPGKHHPATTEVRAGMLERKSKYLKSYTPGWYVLSPTHIHEFKSADRIYTQPPVMSLYLPDQKLGSRSQPGSSSHKFVIKGRQAGSMHRGHTWVFRAETYETMNAWYDDIQTLTEKSGEERNAFVRRHASVRSASAGSARSASSDGGLEEDEADAVPYSANQSMVSQPREQPPTRPSPGGRFPSDLAVNRHLNEPLSPSSGSSDFAHDITTASGGPLQHNVYPMYPANSHSPQPDANPQQYQEPSYINTQPIRQPQYEDSIYADPYTSNYNKSSNQQQPPRDLSYVNPYAGQAAEGPPSEHHGSDYRGWMAPAAGGVAAGALAGEAYRRHQAKEEDPALQSLGTEQQHQPQVDERGVPIDDLTGGTQAHPVDDFTGGTQAQPVDDFTGGTQAQVHPATIIARQGERGLDSGVPTPTANNNAPPFLGEAEAAPAATSGQTVNGGVVPVELIETADNQAFPFPTSGRTVNGGPVPVELIETADKQAFPSVHRTNTDISVSDLHVPGEFPKGPGTPGTANGTFLSYTDRF